ncbi:MAG: ABC transporter permease [Zoogloeaceae bacterium]|jgi:peptide/nickel transport system permease protein|nr:ABC transporter permease [Zoogloeaceae bacterium]
MMARTLQNHVLHLRGWFSDVEPQTRLQARLGAFYRHGRRLVATPSGKMGLALMAVFLTAAALAPAFPLDDPIRQSLAERLLPPSSAHWFGTDHLGRDVFARTVWGARPTFVIVFTVLAVSMPLGALLGTVSGLFGGIIDLVLMRVCDVFMAFPRLIFALAVAAAMGAGMGAAILAISLTAWAPYARVARAETIVLRQSEFILAARTMGASRSRLLFRHALPLALPSALVRAALDAPGIILVVSGLGFLGLCIPAPTPEWGAMVADGRAIVFEAWWVSTLPGFMILLCGIGFNLLGDALRDVAATGEAR